MPTPAPTDTTVSAHVAHALMAYTEHVFGVMGNGNAYLLDALERSNRVHFTAVRHEAGGVVAADAHFRATGRIAIATATYGAGFTNTLTPLAEAAQAHVPLVLVVGDEPTSGPRPWGVDQIALASAVGARTYTVGRTDAVATTVIAIEHALSYKVPVVLAIPYDVATLEAGEPGDVPLLRLPSPLPAAGAANTARIAEIAAALASAERPFLLAGRGAHLAGASEALGALAAATGAVTASTALGRDIFPETQYDLGVTGGFGADGAMDLIHTADVAVVFGAGLNQFTMRFGELFSPSTRVFQVDISATATHAVVSGYVRADARLAAEAITAALPAGNQGAWRESIDRAALLAREPGEALAPDGRLDPRSVAIRIAESLPEDRVIVSDGGHFLGWSNMYWPVASPDRFMMVGTAYQSIGFGFPSVVGAAAARPESAIVLTSGDGGGLMALADLESAVRAAGGRGIGVIWNDGAYGAEVNLYGLKGLATGPMMIPGVNFAALGEAVGAEGVVVTSLDDLDRLATWAAEPVETRKFLLLDCRISTHVIAPYQQEIIRVNS